ncbi:tryptophan halogenase family protein [Roseateles cellulosilyticus]|uniref:Tryptophan 7-halogenase n=1 Tax=Pelomonas cellulosilytica TaxID=2906762 RepID=A0ABS8XR37_9BURK|nr:tryptophan halogenase family protein [Pelomonas sp. P8]MCE4555197.1 tryptophan 7-halogenase [Pelomonas sp. P8]
MPHPLIRDIVIVGGGTAGWMTALGLATVVGDRYRIRLVESDEIGTVGVGEATIPLIQRFNRIVGLDEREFLRETGGTFKLAIEFVDWGRVGERYMHGFGRVGQDLWTVGFEQYWHRMRSLGRARPLGEYAIAQAAARANRFMPARREPANSPLADIAYAYHFDAARYARYLRRLAEARGVQRREGRITHATLTPAGDVDAVVLAGGERITADFFIDCSGFRALLIEETLKTGFDDWSRWLPCDRAVVVPCEPVRPLTPYTRSTAHRAGWQWRIPLQHRTGNGHVYSSVHMSDDEATATLLSHLDGKALGEPRQLRFKAGMRRQAWHRNVVAIGLAAGFLEPLESTSIHLVQQAIQLLIDFFPDRGFSTADVAAFNAQSRFHWERIRDFIVLHYHVNRRDEPFWRDGAGMAAPDTLREKLELYRSHGRVRRVDGELFTETAWLQVLAGQGLLPEGFHPLAALQPEDSVHAYLEAVHRAVHAGVAQMPDHADFLARLGLA